MIQKGSKPGCLLLLWGILFFVSQHLISQEVPANKAAKVRIDETKLEAELAGQKASPDKIFLILKMEWENIHPKQKIEKSKLEGKQDRTMGVGKLTGGGQKGKEEYVDADVAYRIPKLFDHAYALADGKSFALDSLTEKMPNGSGIQKAFEIAKFGEKKKVELVYSIPKEAKNIGFQLFDYANGHILVRVKGDLKLAAGTGGPAGKVLDQIKDELVEFAANKLNFQADYKGEKAAEGWRYALVEIGGKSLSGGGTKDIVQIKPQEYSWLATPEGYFYYSCGGSTTEGGFIRFTPEVYQSQELAFLVPASAQKFNLGLRIRNTVYTLKLSGTAFPELPKALATHRDGNTMEVLVYGVRRQEGRIILDLGIRSLIKSGLEIQASQQFLLVVGDQKVSYDRAATETLFHRPPEPFVIPPQTFVRFELAYQTEAAPASLYYRGYESENYFRLPAVR
jgi:hypothetical protein